MVRFAVLAVIACASGCGPSSPPRAEAPGLRPEIRRYPPLAFAADARAPGFAVVLGTDAAGGSTRLALAATPRAAALAAPPGSIDVATAPSAMRAARVVASSQRDPVAWRAAAWQAALVAAAALGKDPTDIGFTASARGAVDGIRSSATLAAGFLASGLGARPDPEAVVRGVVCPDGTIARIPGHRTIRDVAAAYRALTGAVLPRAVPVAAADMAVATDDRLAVAYAAWHARLAPHWARVLDVDTAGGRPVALVALARGARDAVRDAEALRSRRAWIAAEDRVADGWVLAQAAALVGDTVDRVADGDLAAARAGLDAIDAVLRLADGAALPAPGTTIDGALLEIEAGHRRIAARAWARRARERVIAARAALDRLGGTRALATHEVADAIVAAVAPAALAAGRAAREAHRVPSPAPGRALPYTPSPPDLRGRAHALRSAATAALAYLDARGVDPGPVARAAVDADAAPALVAELAVLDAWLAVVDRDSFGVTRDAVTGLLTGAAHADALRALLPAADAAARGHARAARVATGSIPAQARAAYQIARAHLDGASGVADQHAALAALWRSSAWSQMAIALARNRADAPGSQAPAP
jgi:hypothetical protein